MIKKLMALSFVLGFSFSGLCAADDLESLDSPERDPVRSRIVADSVILISGGDMDVSDISCRSLYIKTSGTCRFSGCVEASSLVIDAGKVVNEGSLSVVRSLIIPSQSILMASFDPYETGQLLSAEFVSLSSQAAMSLVRNEGNIGPTAQSLANSETFKSF